MFTLIHDSDRKILRENVALRLRLAVRAANRLVSNVI
jgi:hypothetical protein